MPSLFVGITAWNSDWFLGDCLDSLREKTKGHRLEIVVFDNHSTDGTVEIAKRRGAKVKIGNSGQGTALNWLFAQSRAELTLLIHADVVFLSENWFPICYEAMSTNTVLVSPKDIGLGPMTRGYHDKPESSFMLFHTRRAKRLMRWYSTQRFKIKWPWRGINFYGPHITHDLPKEIAEAGLTWEKMDVWESPRAENPIYRCEFPAANWKPEYADSEYGFGNFYSLNGQLTHYHNWYNRANQVPTDSTEVHPTDHLPLAFFRVYGERFLNHYRSNQLQIPGKLRRST